MINEAINPPPKGTTLMNIPIAVTITDKVIQALNFLGSFRLRSCPSLLKNIPFEKETLFITASTTNSVGSNISARAPMPYPKQAQVIAKFKQTFARLKVVFLSVLLKSMTVLFKGFIHCRISYNVLRFKVTALLLFSIFGNSNIYAADNVKAYKNVKMLIGQAEKEYDIPKNLLLSIALVESGVNPYALNVNGKAVLSESASEVKRKLKEYLRAGHSSIDIGVMQVNYRWHREKFANLDEMLDPMMNIDYAARFLKQLYETHGSWIMAVRHYHSANPEYHKKYSRKIIITWLGV